MTDTSKKSQRRRSLGGLLSSSIFTTPPTSHAQKDPSLSSGATPPAPARTPQDRIHIRQREPSSSPSSSSKLQKRSRPRSSGSGSLLGTMTGGFRADGSVTMADGSVQKGDSPVSSHAAMVSNNGYHNGQRHHSGNTPPRVPSHGQIPSLHEHAGVQQRQPLPRSKSTTQKSLRNSVFGSFRSFGSAEDDQRSTRTRSKTSSDEEDFLMAMRLGGGGLQVLHYGEVQMTGAMRRKRTQFLVLTDTHLVRFKNQTKASEAFPSIPVAWGRSSSGSFSAASRQSVVSLASMHDGPLVGSNGEPVANNIPLSSVIAARTTKDAKTNSFSIEVCYMEQRAYKASFLHIQVKDEQDFRLWQSGIRNAASRLHVVDSNSDFNTASIDYVIRALNQEDDYDADAFRMFKVAQRLPVKRHDDPTRHSPPTLSFLAIGRHKIHIVPFPKPDRSSMVSLSNNGTDLGLCLGIMCLSAFIAESGEDDFQMDFRVPFRSAFPVYLSSIFCPNIALAIWQRAEFLRPQYLRQPFLFKVSPRIYYQMVSSNREEEEYGCFDRTLVSYMAAYHIRNPKIRYNIDHECEDAPAFRLLPPDDSKDGSGYSSLELLAVLRSLRYNEAFRTISFSGVKLDILANARDTHEVDLDARQTRAHSTLFINGQDSLSILSQEVRALTLKSTQLKRLDFSFSLTKDPGLERVADDLGCGIPEAIFPVCKRHLTNVDWIMLNGIRLVDADLDYLVDAASEKGSHLRALEVSHCGISIHNLNLVLSTLAAQEETLEAINISGVQGRLSPELFQQQIGYFANIRKIKLSHVTAGSEPLITEETLLNWQLEELCLSHMTVNEKTVESIAAYLASPQSHRLWELRLDQCGLTGASVAKLLSCMVDDEGRARNIHLHVSENRLHVNHSELVDAIAQNKNPTHLTMKMMEFPKEEHFRQLVDSLRTNTTLRYLDISKASLPYDAGPETCKALQLMFEENESIEELDISGEYAHLEVTRFGIGLNEALTGLKRNTTLKVLKIEYQKLGIQGATTLSSVLAENDSLAEVHCDHNELNLQAFTILVNGLQRNRSLLYLPCMNRDREVTLERVRREMEAIGDTKETKSAKVGSFRRTFQAATAGMRSTSGGNKLTKPNSQSRHNNANNNGITAAGNFPTRDAVLILRGLGGKWDEQVQRVQRYLYRNYVMANAGYEAYSGIDGPVVANGGGSADWEGASDGRPATAASLGTMLRQIALEPVEPEPSTSVATQAPESTRSEEEDDGLVMRSISRMPSFRHGGDNHDTNGQPPVTPGRFDLSREFASPEPRPPSSSPAPAFLKEDNRNISASSVPTTRSTNSATAQRAFPLYPNHDSNTNATTTSFRSAESTSTLTARPNNISPSISRTVSPSRSAAPASASSSFRGLNFMTSRSADKRKKLPEKERQERENAGGEGGSEAPRLGLELPDMKLF